MTLCVLIWLDFKNVPYIRILNIKAWYTKLSKNTKLLTAAKRLGLCCTALVVSPLLQNFKNVSLIFKLLKKLLRNPHNQEAKYKANNEDEVAVAILNTHHNKLWAATGPNIAHLLNLLPLHSCVENMHNLT